MFCPKCGKEIPEIAGFCPACGHRIADASSGGTSEDSVNRENSDPQSTNSGEAFREDQKPGKRSKLPIVFAVLLVAVAAVFALHFLKVIDLSSVLPFMPGQEQGHDQNEPSSTDDGQGASEEAQPSETGDEGSSSKRSSEISGNSSSSQSSDGSTNPKDAIAISSLKLDVDSGGRYVISGKVSNNGDMEYTPKLELSATKHDVDKYNEEVTEKTTTFGLISAATNISCDGNTITAAQLQPKETRAFTVYPERWDSSDISYSDVSADVAEVTLPASVLRRQGYLLDVGGKMFSISDLTYNASGVVSGTVTNNSKTYIDKAWVSFVMLDAQGSTVPSKRNSTRPSGVLLYSAEVRTLKPGASAEFEKNVGEGFGSAKYLDIAYVPDESKNNVS